MQLKRCPNCNVYTLKEFCPKCKEKSVSAHPPKFSIEMEKKYGKYRKV